MRGSLFLWEIDHEGPACCGPIFTVAMLKSEILNFAEELPAHYLYMSHRYPALKNSVRTIFLFWVQFQLFAVSFLFFFFFLQKPEIRKEVSQTYSNSASFFTGQAGEVRVSNNDRSNFFLNSHGTAMQAVLPPVFSWRLGVETNSFEKALRNSDGAILVVEELAQLNVNPKRYPAGEVMAQKFREWEGKLSINGVDAKKERTFVHIQAYSHILVRVSMSKLYSCQLRKNFN